MKQELFTLRFQRESGQLEDMSRIRKTRREVARIATTMRQQEIAAWESQQEEQADG